MPSTAAAKPVVSMHHHASEIKASEANSASSHGTGTSSLAHARAPGSLFQSPIRPTQVEPSTPDVHSASPAGKQSRPKQPQQQQQPHALFRPPVHNVPQARRSSLIFVIVLYTLNMTVT